MSANEKRKMDAKDWIIITLGIIILLLGVGCGIYYHKYQKAEGQVVIWNDSTYIYKNKYDEEYAAKNAYILKTEQLQKYNNELYAEYKSLKDHPIVITKTVVVTKIDSVNTNTHDVNYKDSTLTWNWSASDKDYYSINGISKANILYPNQSLTFINNLTINAKLTLDVIDNGQQLSVIAKSDNPYMDLGVNESVIIDPKESPTISKYYKPKRWGLSIYLGLGANFGWDPVHNNIGFNLGPSAGVAVTYDLIQW